MKYYLGLDNGGTTTKAALFDASGNEIAKDSMKTNMIVPKPGFTERDMEEMWQANIKVIRGVIKKAGIKGEDISCIACCGHGKGLYLWGKDNKPVRNGIISTDNRAWKYPEQWKKEGVTKQVYEYTCQEVMSCQPVSLLAWLRDHEPNTLEATQWIFECKDYIRYRLTGEAYAEITDYSGTNLVNLHTGEYDSRILSLFGIEDCFDKLPPLKLSTDICGSITKDVAAKTGLAAGTPVAGGAFDIDACALAVSVVNDDHICMIAGTWSINEYIRKSPVLDGSVMMNSFFCIPEYYLIEECSPTSAGNVEWMIENLLHDQAKQAAESGSHIYDMIDNWIQNQDVAEFYPIFLPFLMASNVHPNAMSSFVGLSSFHNVKHLARSVYEGVAFSHRYHLEKLLSTKESASLSIRLAGGVARSEVWTQMFADIMKYPIECVNVQETGAFGCAIICAVAVGDYDNLEDAAKNMCKIADPVYPDKARSEIYDQKYSLYMKTINSLDGLWDSIQNYRDSYQTN